MPSTKRLEDTLPLQAPATSSPAHLPQKGVDYSVYLTVSLDETGQNRLLQDINSNRLGTQTCRFAPHAHQQSTLREAYEHHIGTRDGDHSIHPYFFIVADEDYHQSVLAVYLKAPTTRDDAQHVVGVCRCAVAQVDLMGSNLDIGNIDWIEYKEAEQAEWTDEDVYKNERYFATDPREQQNVQEAEGEKPIFAWFSFVRKAVPINGMLETNWTNLQPHQRRFAFASNASLFDEPWTEVRRTFPYACWTNPRIHRSHLLIAEREDAEEQDGMAIYRVLWDAEVELGKFPAFEKDVPIRDQPHQRNVRGIMPEIEFVERVKASEVLVRMGELSATPASSQ